MRTVLLSSVAALGLTFATGSLVPANAQAPAAPASATDPSQMPSADTSTPSGTPDAPAPAPEKHHRISRHAAGGDAGTAWAHQPGTGQSGPASLRASNIDSADTRSDIAPHFPQPAVGDGADPDKLLQAAQAAIAAHKTGTAQQALEMAETRLLDRSTAVNAAGQPDPNPRVAAVSQARKALASGDTQAADTAIQTALTTKE